MVFIMKKNWSYKDALAEFSQPLFSLINKAQNIHLKNFEPNEIQVSTLLSIKTGKCPENCSYCPQSAHYNTGLKYEPLMELDEVIQSAQAAKAKGSTRFCLGAAWRGPRDRDVEKSAK